LIEITYNGSNVLIMCVVGVWRQHMINLCESLQVISVKVQVITP